MDKELENELEQIKTELNRLHYRWTLYRELFATNPHRIEIINRTSSNVFSEFQFLVIDSMLMSLSKLTDSAKTGKNSNLSFPHVLNRVRDLGEEQLAKSLETELEALQAACEKFREIRNKRVAHNDLATYTEERESPLPGVSRAEIESALEHSRNLINLVELHFKDSQTLYEEIILPLTDNGRSVVIWLQKGLAYEQAEDQGLIENGTWRDIGPIDSV